MTRVRKKNAKRAQNRNQVDAMKNPQLLDFQCAIGTSSAPLVTVATDRKANVHDENLLERARTQWQFGDWESLAQLNRDTLQYHPDRAHLALLAAAGQLQTGLDTEAKANIRLAQEWGVSKKLISQILIAGVYNSIGRAAAIGNQKYRALQHFESAITIGSPASDAKLLTEARITQQFHQLGLPPLKGYPKVGIGKPEARIIAKAAVLAWIDEVLAYAPDAPPLLIAAAEAAQRSGDLDSAIRYWQRLASVDGTLMKQTYYERLSEAYKQIKGFPRGSDEEETLRGDFDKYQLLKNIHQTLQPRSYLEIGVQAGRSLLLAACPALGVDPMPMVTVPLPDRITLVRTTSDQFFADQAMDLLRAPVDMAFIDGMHLFEYALRDFMNVEKYANPNTLVVIDDILPGHPAQAERDRRTRAWTGDVWKLLPILRRHRPDLSLLMLDAHPTGLLCISGLNPASTELQAGYESIVAEWSDDAPVPDDVISRNGALSCANPELGNLLARLRALRASPEKRGG